MVFWTHFNWSQRTVSCLQENRKYSNISTWNPLQFHLICSKWLQNDSSQPNPTQMDLHFNFKTFSSRSPGASSVQVTFNLSSPRIFVSFWSDITGWNSQFYACRFFNRAFLHMSDDIEYCIHIFQVGWRRAEISWRRYLQFIRRPLQNDLLASTERVA